jgi:hypothetical protein
MFVTTKYKQLTLYPWRGSRDMSDIRDTHVNQNELAVRNTADVTVGMPTAVYLKCENC